MCQAKNAANRNPIITKKSPAERLKVKNNSFNLRQNSNNYGYTYDFSLNGVVLTLREMQADRNAAYKQPVLTQMLS